MRFLSGRLIVAAGVVLALAGLLAFSLAAPTTTVGQETDVSPPASSPDDGFGADVGAGATGPEAEPPASLPDTGNGGYLETGGSAQVLLVSMLAALGVTLAGAGAIAVRRGRQIRREG